MAAHANHESVVRHGSVKLNHSSLRHVLRSGVVMETGRCIQTGHQFKRCNLASGNPYRLRNIWFASIMASYPHMEAGIVAVFDFHNHNKIPNMYSLHSWCGMLTFVLFCVQWLMGLGFFLFPGTLMALRSWYLPLHVFFGLAMLAMSLASCLLGISEKLFFSIQHTYSQFAPEGILGNMLGLLLVAFGILVGYVVTREDFRRPPHPEEEALSVHFKTLTEGRGSPTSP
uniref:Transmembrane ascorbate-dependent reductase CYB561 n=1 Tax=Oncorhynchus kisutch TaxID=8019 RepID=A0A8C7D7E1_ONCKI